MQPTLAKQPARTPSWHLQPWRCPHPFHQAAVGEDLLTPHVGWVQRPEQPRPLLQEREHAVVGASPRLPSTLLRMTLCAACPQNQMEVGGTNSLSLAIAGSTGSIGSSCTVQT